MVMPVGLNFGWGLCGRYLTLEMNEMVDVVFITQKFTLKEIGDPFHYSALKKLVPSMDTLKSIAGNNEIGFIDKPVVQAIQGANLMPCFIKVKSPQNIGYTFFEDNVLKEHVEIAKEYYDVIITGSSWCEKILNDLGLNSTKTIIQGVDPNLFNGDKASKKHFKDKFVIFSGGKLELRKGQDLVIRAFKVLQDKYDDVILVNSWYNHWDQSIATMSSSPYIRFEMPGDDYFKAVNHLLIKNGINPEKVITLPPKPYGEMPEVYRNTDLGLFPNRCEGGTNLVLMEYMACGKPAIASFSSGHKDILTRENSLLIEALKTFDIRRKDGDLVASWDDPDLDEIIAKLEWAYLNKDQLQNIAEKAQETMSNLTWKESAKQFYNLIFERNI